MSIDIEHVGFSYGKHQVLRDVNASIPDGVLVNVLGPNGVGKSTLFRCILCLNSDYEGVIRVNGKDLRDLSVRERAREISYIPQTHAPVYNYKVRDVVLMSTGADVGIFGTPGREQVERAEQALERIGIGHLGIIKIGIASFLLTRIDVVGQVLGDIAIKHGSENIVLKIPAVNGTTKFISDCPYRTMQLVTLLFFLCINHGFPSPFRSV